MKERKVIEIKAFDSKRIVCYHQIYKKFIRLSLIEIKQESGLNCHIDTIRSELHLIGYNCIVVKEKKYICTKNKENGLLFSKKTETEDEPTMECALVDEATFKLGKDLL